MNWLHLQGHGGFVWGSYGVALLALVLEAVAVCRQLRRAQAQARQADAPSEGNWR